MVDFKFFLNRQGPQGIQGPQGEKGEKGDSITISQGTNTPTTYTLIFDKGDGNTFETDNLRYPLEDRGGTYVRWDGGTTQYLGDPDYADLNHNPGEVALLNGSDFNTADLEVYGDYAVSGQFMLAFFNNLSDVFQDITDNLTSLNNGKADKATTYTKTEVDNSLALKADKSTTYTKTETNSLLNGKANTVHTHTLSQITNAGSLAGKDTVNYNTDITNKPTLGSLAAKNTVDYVTEVTNKPTIPTVGNGTITITQGGVNKGTFTTNQSGNTTISLDAGGGGGSTYTAGNGIDITSDTISAKVDGTTIGINSTTKEIELKASIPAAQIQSDWSQVDNTKVDFIKNKPTIPDTTNMVTTNTAQNITGLKTFKDYIHIDGGNLDVHDSETYVGTFNSKPQISFGLSGGYSSSISLNSSELAITLNHIGSRINVYDGNYASIGSIAYTKDIGNGTITLTQGATTLGTFSVNQSGNQSINIPGGSPTINFESRGGLITALDCIHNENYPGFAEVEEITLSIAGEGILQVEGCFIGTAIMDQPFYYQITDKTSECGLYLNGTSLKEWDGAADNNLQSNVPISIVNTSGPAADRYKKIRFIHRLEISNNTLVFKYKYAEDNSFTTLGTYTLTGFNSNKWHLDLLGAYWAGRSCKGSIYFENTFISDLNGNILWQPVSN